MLEYVDGTPNAYQPGVCNIGPAEIRRRQQIGWLGLGAAVGLGAFLLAVDAPAFTRLAVALPVAASISGFLQARMRFCAGFGMAGVQNFGAIGDEQKIADSEAVKADRRKALQIQGVAAFGGLLAGLVFTLLPL